MDGWHSSRHPQKRKGAYRLSIASIHQLRLHFDRPRLLNEYPQQDSFTAFYRSLLLLLLHILGGLIKNNKIYTHTNNTHGRLIYPGKTGPAFPAKEYKFGLFSQVDLFTIDLFTYCIELEEEILRFLIRKEQKKKKMLL